MHRSSRSAIRFALALSVLCGLVALPGCEDSRTKTGTLVEQTPEQKAAEKASMDGMKKAMENMPKAK